MIHVEHPFEAIYNEKSEILILGSFPSVKSRENLFFYGHKQNRFWKVISGIFGENEPKTIPEKKDLLLRNHIALWDVIKSCDIEGSSDSSIKNVIPNDLSLIFQKAKIKKIILNGKIAEKYYKLHIESKFKKTAKYLPSTSSANAKWNLKSLIKVWSFEINGAGERI